MISEPTNQEETHFVDAPGGNKQPLKPSGMVPNYAEKKEFGKVPSYIKKLKKSRIEEQKQWEDAQQEILRKREMMKLQANERDALAKYFYAKLLDPGVYGSFVDSVSGRVIHLDGTTIVRDWYGHRDTIKDMVKGYNSRAKEGTRITNLQS